MNFDFSALNFETIDSNINAYPDMYINLNGVTFTKKAGVSRLCAVPAGCQGEGFRDPYVQKQRAEGL